MDLHAFARHLDLATAQQLGAALEHGDLVFLHEELDALAVLEHDAVLALDDGRQVRPHLGHVHPGDAVVRQLGHLPVAVRGLQPGLGGDAAATQAGAAQSGRIPLHDGRAEPQLRRANGGDVAARTGTDDDEIERGNGAHGPTPLPVVRRA
jgi:hypothetical protein